jgi:hypothetical protein
MKIHLIDYWAIVRDGFWLNALIWLWFLTLGIAIGKTV